MRFLTVISFLLLTGCLGDGKVSVSGDVSVTGSPVDQGTIRFEPSDGKGPTDGATIAGGRYTVKLTPGKKNVYIEGHQQVGEEKQNPDDPSSPILPVFEPIVKVQVTADIDAGQSDLNFDLPAQ